MSGNPLRTLVFLGLTLTLSSGFALSQSAAPGPNVTLPPEDSSLAPPTYGTQSW
jgi:hypothetical protein